MVLELKQIAHIETPFRTKFGVPRQAGLVEAPCRVVFEPEFRVAEAVRGLEDFDYVWLLWGFHLNGLRDGETSRHRDGETSRHQDFETSGLQDGETSRLQDEETSVGQDLKSRRLDVLKSASWSPTVRPPRLGGNKRVGVFATRSPNRPNPVGLSSVKLLGISHEPGLGPVLTVAGADLVDGTPIYDIKPYVAYADSHEGARSGFAAEAPRELLSVSDPEGVLSVMPEDEADALRKTLALDPRPHYQDDPERVYGMEYGEYEVKFRVSGKIVVIVCLTHSSVSPERADSSPNVRGAARGDEC